MHHMAMNKITDHKHVELDAPRPLKTTFKRQKRRWSKLQLWARRVDLMSRFEVTLAVLAMISIIATYVALFDKPGPADVLSRSSSVRGLMIFNLILMLGLGYSISRWLVKVWYARKEGTPGSRLHTRFVAVFAIISILPSIVMGVFSILFLEFQVQNWFSDNVRNVIQNSLQVAETYEIEHRATTEKDLLSIGFAFNSLIPGQRISAFEIEKMANDMFNKRQLDEIIVFDKTGSILTRASRNLDFATTKLPPELVSRAMASEIVVNLQKDSSIMEGLMQLNGFIVPTYLYISRQLDAKVLTYLDETRKTVAEYKNLEGQGADILTQFTMAFVIVAFLLLLVSIWVGLSFASRLVNPLSMLLTASEKVARGDMSARVPVTSDTDEVGTLSRAFNRMTDELSHQQSDLIAANDKLDNRSRFLEEVLSGVSAGVIGVASDRKIFLPNRSACYLLGRHSGQLIGEPITEAIPEMKELVDQAQLVDGGMAQGEVMIDVQGDMRTLLVRVADERVADERDGDVSTGLVITFDDLTEQLADQRTAAWADVARRIAHEIKNPLTPIQLSAERLKRKYLKEIVTDPGVFSQCTDTIIRQVGDLRQMVDEFSSFARMPAPRFKETDAVDVVKKAIFLQDVANASISYSIDVSDDIQSLMLDERLIGQAVTNLLKNASESVFSRFENKSDKDEDGHIFIKITQDNMRTEIIIGDNGIGLPVDRRDRLLEPYVTTRAKGTGLGLAIVRKIMEDHGGTIRLSDRNDCGANATLSFNHDMLNKKFINKSNRTDDIDSAYAAQ